MTDDLVKRLRATCSCNIDDTPCLAEEECRVAQEAADRIDELEAKLAACEKYRDAYAECDRIATQTVRDLEAKLQDMALDCLAAQGQAAEAYQAQLVALELADAALSGANMNMRAVEKKVKAAIAELKREKHD
jgi:hypothetical protein